MGANERPMVSTVDLASFPFCSWDLKYGPLWVYGPALTMKGRGAATASARDGGVSTNDLLATFTSNLDSTWGCPQIWP